jgi:hypothetical protein
MPEHSAITDPNLHEPKGASTASANTAYWSDGAGSGTWAKADMDNIDQSALLTFINDNIDDKDIDLTGSFYLLTELADVSTASSILVPVVDNCTLVSARLVLAGAIATANASVTFTNSAAASMGAAVTVTFAGSAEGTSFTFTASGNNVFVGPTWFKITTDGASDNAVKLFITCKFSAELNP